MPKLLALRREGVVARFWRFDPYELLFQSVLTFIFCLVIFYGNRNHRSIFRDAWVPKVLLVLKNLLILSIFTGVGAVVQLRYFQPGFFPTGGYTLRFSLSLILVLLELRIAQLLQESRTREMENEVLRNAWLKSQLALLKGQLNPHFFFNAMSSLSSIVREDPRKAQQYIHHLSKVFRNSMNLSDTDLVSLKDELEAVRSYCELLKMRYEDGFRLDVSIDGLAAESKIPPMSLQLLVENALKHNSVSAAHPLYISISMTGEWLEVMNNLSPACVPEPGAGIGLANLNERFSILFKQEIEIIKTDEFFIVRLPLSGRVDSASDG